MAEIQYNFETKECSGLPERSSHKNYNFNFTFGNAENKLIKKFQIKALVSDEKRDELGDIFTQDNDFVTIGFRYEKIFTPIHENLTLSEYQTLENLGKVDNVKVYFITDVAPAQVNLNELTILNDTTKWNAINDAINLIQKGNELL